jgi:nitrate reductase gamma subunit
MTTVVILFIFVVCPLLLAAFIIAGAIYRARQHKKVWDAAQKYIHS